MASTRVSGPILPKNMEMPRIAWPQDDRSGVRPVLSPTVPKLETLSNSKAMKSNSLFVGSLRSEVGRQDLYDFLVGRGVLLGLPDPGVLSYDS